MLARVAGVLWPSTILQGNSHHLFRCRSVEGQRFGLMSGDCTAPARSAATYSRHCASAIIVWGNEICQTCPAAHCPAAAGQKARRTPVCHLQACRTYQSKGSSQSLRHKWSKTYTIY